MITEREITETISKIEERLADKRVNRFVNAPVKEGYLKSIEILRDHQTDKPGLNWRSLKQFRVGLLLLWLLTI